MKLILIGFYVLSSISAFAGPPIGYEEQVKRSFVNDKNVQDFVANLENSLNTNCRFKKISSLIHGHTLWDEGGVVGLYECSDSNLELKVRTYFSAKDKTGESLRPLDKVNGIYEIRFSHKVKKITLKY